MGRFAAVDPIADEFPGVTPFNFAENSPIANIDLWGLQKYYTADGSFLTQNGKSEERRVLNQNFSLDANNGYDYNELFNNSRKILTREDVDLSMQKFVANYRDADIEHLQVFGSKIFDDQDGTLFKGYVAGSIVSNADAEAVSMLDNDPLLPSGWRREISIHNHPNPNRHRFSDAQPGGLLGSGGLEGDYYMGVSLQIKTIMERHKIMIIFIVFQFHFSCQENNKVLDDFFISLEQKINEREILAFRNAPIDSAKFYFGWFYEEYKMAFNQEILDNKKAVEYLEDLQIQTYEIPDYLYLVYNFHGWLNGKRYTAYECWKIHEHVVELEQMEERKLEEETLRVILNNQDRWVIGDTLDLIFPAEDRNHWKKGAKEAILRPYPYSMEMFDFEDTIKLKGVLKNKILDSLDMRFVIQIINLNVDDIIMLGNEYEVGDTLNLPLSIYGKPIE